MAIKTRRKILTNSLAAEILLEGKELAKKSPALGIDFGKEKGLLTSPCGPCRKQTPTVSTVVSDFCLLCSTEKNN